MKRVVFHAHTQVSHDSLVPLSAVLEKLTQLGVTDLIITEHNRLVHYPESHSAIRIITAEEINTQEGEIIGVFLQEEIPAGLSLKETIARIREQGGIIVAPHPFDRLRKKVLRREHLLTHIHEIDCIEVFNARVVFRHDNSLADMFAETYDKPKLYGSDAHTVYEYGNTWIEGLDCTSSQSFLASLPTSRPQYQYAPLWVHGVTKYVKWRFPSRNA